MFRCRRGEQSAPQKIDFAKKRHFSLIEIRSPSQPVLYALYIPPSLLNSSSMHLLRLLSLLPVISPSSIVVVGQGYRNSEPDNGIGARPAPIDFTPGSDYSKPDPPARDCLRTIAIINELDELHSFHGGRRAVRERDSSVPSYIWPWLAWFGNAAGSCRLIEGSGTLGYWR